MAYTAEVFDSVLASIKEADEAGEGIPPPAAVIAALRIASAVMRPGVIEQAMFEFKYNDPPALADAIRAALTDAKP
jgi:hypothetical protein